MFFSNSKVNLNEIFKLKNNSKNFNEHEIQLIKKISEWPNCVKLSADNLEPHKITFFYMILQQYFMLIGIWANKIMLTNLLMIQIKLKKMLMQF